MRNDTLMTVQSVVQCLFIISKALMHTAREAVWILLHFKPNKKQRLVLLMVKPSLLWQ